MLMLIWGENVHNCPNIYATMQKFLMVFKYSISFHLNHYNLWPHNAQHDFVTYVWGGMGGQLCITSNITLFLVVFMSFGDEYSLC